MYECRCDERLKVIPEGSTFLGYPCLREGLGHVFKGGENNVVVHYENLKGDLNKDLHTSVGVMKD